MTESNFVSEADFEKLLNSLPIQTSYSKMSREDWYWYLRLQSGSALRPKEETKLTPEQFDLEHRLITLNQTKTGWKHCKCSKWEAPPNSKRNTILLSSDKDCKKCKGEGWVRVPQQATILPQDAWDFKSYLKSKQQGKPIWPISRQTVWAKFKKLCEIAGLSYFWQKDERAFKKGWPYLLRSSRGKIMEKDGFTLSYVMRKLRHKKGSVVTFAYTEIDIHALLAKEAEMYPLVKKKFHYPWEALKVVA